VRVSGISMIFNTHAGSHPLLPLPRSYPKGVVANHSSSAPQQGM